MRCLFNERIKKLKLYYKIDYLWLLAANSDIKKGYLSIDNDLNNTLMTTISSLNHFSNKLQKKWKNLFFFKLRCLWKFEI